MFLVHLFSINERLTQIPQDRAVLVLLGYLLLEEHIVLRTSAEGLPDLVHVQLDIKVIDLCGSGRGREQPSQDRSKIENVCSIFSSAIWKVSGSLQLG